MSDLNALMEQNFELEEQVYKQSLSVHALETQCEQMSCIINKMISDIRLGLEDEVPADTIIDNIRRDLQESAIM